MKRRRISAKKTAYALALAGISAALALLFVWLGVVVRYVTVAMFAAAETHFYEVLPLSLEEIFIS